MARVDVTVVVPCRDRPELLDRCLTGLRTQLAIFDELIVVDSASASAEVASVAAHHGAVLVRCDEPGASRARNAGWRAARHPVVAFVDDDVVVDPGWVDAIVAPLEQPDTGFVVGPYRLPEGVHLDGPSATLTTIEPPAVMTTAMVGVFGAGNLAMHRRVLERVGGFDERLGPGCWLAAGEDLELLDRVTSSGLVGRYAPDAVGRHLRWRSHSASVRLQWHYGLGMGGRAAAAVRREGTAAWPMVSELLRLHGLVTVARRVTRTGRRAEHRQSSSEPDGADVSGWLGPVLWRLGAAVGFVAGLVLLPPRRERT